MGTTKVQAATGSLCHKTGSGSRHVMSGYKWGIDPRRSLGMDCCDCYCTEAEWVVSTCNQFSVTVSPQLSIAQYLVQRLEELLAVLNGGEAFSMLDLSGISPNGIG